MLPVRDEEAAAAAETTPSTPATTTIPTDTTNKKSKKKKKETIPPRVTWGQAPLVRTLLRLYRRPLLVTGVLKLCLSLVQFAPPLIISRLLRVLEAGGACVHVTCVVG